MLQVPTKRELPPPTDEQVHILDLVRNPTKPLQIRALAGTGKTTMLEMISEVIKPPMLCLALNTDVTKKMKQVMPSWAEVRSFNSCGHRAWNAVVGNCKITEDTTPKMYTILRELTNEHKGEDAKLLKDSFGDFLRAVNTAKNLGYVPEGKFPSAKRLITREQFHASLDSKPDQFEAEIIDSLLFRSIKSAYDRWIDFNDQIYMPTVFRAPFLRYSSVLVDEEQDLNAVNHEMLRMLAKGWFCGVGDPWQSIYAFRGAVQDGMGKLQAAFQAEEADLRRISNPLS